MAALGVPSCSVGFNVGLQRLLGLGEEGCLNNARPPQDSHCFHCPGGAVKLGRHVLVGVLGLIYGHETHESLGLIDVVDFGDHGTRQQAEVFVDIGDDLSLAAPGSRGGAVDELDGILCVPFPGWNRASLGSAFDLARDEQCGVDCVMFGTRVECEQDARLVASHCCF